MNFTGPKFTVSPVYDTDINSVRGESAPGANDGDPVAASSMNGALGRLLNNAAAAMQAVGDEAATRHQEIQDAVDQEAQDRQGEIDQVNGQLVAHNAELLARRIAKIPVSLLDRTPGAITVIPKAEFPQGTDGFLSAASPLRDAAGTLGWYIGDADADNINVLTVTNSCMGDGGAGNFVTPDPSGEEQWPSLDALRTGPWYHGGAPYAPSKNDYAIFVKEDSTAWRAVFDGDLWSPTFQVGTGTLPPDVLTRRVLTEGVDYTFAHGPYVREVNVPEQALNIDIYTDGITPEGGTGETDIKGWIYSNSAIIAQSFDRVDLNTLRLMTDFNTLEPESASVLNGVISATFMVSNSSGTLFSVNVTAEPMGPYYAGINIAWTMLEGENPYIKFYTLSFNVGEGTELQTLGLDMSMEFVDQVAERDDFTFQLLGEASAFGEYTGEEDDIKFVIQCQNITSHSILSGAKIQFSINGEIINPSQYNELMVEQIWEDKTLHNVLVDNGYYYICGWGNFSFSDLDYSRIGAEYVIKTGVPA